MATMERDVEAAVEAGADGVVFGMLQADGQIDSAADETDSAVDWEAAGGVSSGVRCDAGSVQRLWSKLVDLGITRILDQRAER